MASISLIGQSCVDNVELSTPAFGGDIELNPIIFLDNPATGETYTADPAVVGCDDIGDITITISSANGFSCESSLTLVDNTPPVAVVDNNIVVSLSQSGTAQIFPETVDDGSYDGCSDVTLSLSQTEFDCDDLGEVDVVLTVTDASGNTNQAFTTITVEDHLAPMLFTNDLVNISFGPSGEINLDADWLLEGPGATDNCGVTSTTLSPSFFDCTSAGLQNVIVTATDDSGNVHAEVVQVMLEDKLAPIPVVVNASTAILSAGPGDLVPSIRLYPEDFDFGSYDNCGIVNMTINKEVYTCEDVGENEVIFTVYDAAGNSNSAITTVNIIDNGTTATAISCVEEVTYSTFTNLPFTVTPYDLLAGGPYGCEFIFYLEIKDENDEVVPDNLITADYLGQTLIYTIYDWNSTESCWGNIIISDEDLGCEFGGEDDIAWPLELIELDLLNVDSDDVTPEYISNQPGFTFEDAYPTIASDSCNLVAITYTDIVLPSGLFSYKILREFTVLDWVNYDPSTGEGLYEFTQIIKNNNYPAWYICDTLPRSAPLGDCDSGHTLDDDVEWPNDITIADHRYSPSELVNFSNVVIDDAEPQFSGEDAEFYVLTYEDSLGSITPEVINIERIWTVTHLDIPDLDFSYIQKITISFVDFNNLVAVNTHGNRGVPEVELGNNIFTDQFGKAVVEDDFFINPTFIAEPLNGVDLVDLYLARQHVLGNIELNEYQLSAAEFTGDQELTTLDLVFLARTIIGIEEDNIDLSFANITGDQTGISQVKGHYVAIRSGDINDDIVLPGEATVNLSEVDLTFEDQLLNNGESYSIPFYSDAMINATGIELRMQFNPSAIEILDINSEMFNSDVHFNANLNTGILTIIAYDVDESTLLDGSEALFEISAKALDNKILSEELLFSSVHRSFITDEDLEKYRINGSVDNQIGNVGTNDNELAANIKVFPNPSVDFITVDVSKASIDDNYKVSLFDSQGQLILSQQNDGYIVTSNLPTGSYVIYLTSGESYYSEIIQIQH